MSKGVIQAAEILAAIGLEFAGVRPIADYFRDNAVAQQSSVLATPDINPIFNPINILYIVIGIVLLGDVIRKTFFSKNA